MAQPLNDQEQLPPPAAPDSADGPDGQVMTLLVAAVIVHDREHNRVVLLQRGPAAKFAAGHWDLPVGKQDPGEPITATAVRELREETGLVVEPESLRVAHLVHSARGVEAPNGFLTVVFVTHEWSGELVNAEPHKASQVRWTDAGTPPEPFVPSMGEALSRYLAGEVSLSLRGWHGGPSGP